MMISFYGNESRSSRTGRAPLTPLLPVLRAAVCVWSPRRYVIFLNEQKSQLRAEHPDLPFPEITKMLAAQWAQLSQEKKQVSPFL